MKTTAAFIESIAGDTEEFIELARDASVKRLELEGIPGTGNVYEYVFADGSGVIFSGDSFYTFDEH